MIPPAPLTLEIAGLDRCAVVVGGTLGGPVKEIGHLVIESVVEVPGHVVIRQLLVDGGFDNQIDHTGPSVCPGYLTPVEICTTQEISALFPVVLL